MGDKHGIFIRSQEKDIGLIIKGCVALLNDLNGDKSGIKAAKTDEKYGGFRVYFYEDSFVASFLKQKYLPALGERASIHSFTTKLVVHDFISDSPEDAEGKLQVQIEDLYLKPVLGVSSIPVSTQYPGIQSGNWLVEVDIPEIEDLDKFKYVGLPDSMRLWLSGNGKDSQEKRVSFFCSICHNLEHSRERCPEIKISFLTSAECELGDLSENKEAISENFPKFEIRDPLPKTATSPSTSKEAKQQRIEAIASDLEKRKIQSSSTIQEKIEIKQEPMNEEFFKTASDMTLKRSCKRTDNKNSSKKMRFDTSIMSPLDDDSLHEGKPSATSTTGRESPEPEIVFETSSSRRLRKSFDGENSSHEDYYNLPNLPTSSQPETSFESFRGDIFSRDASDFSDSNETVRMPKMTRKKPIYAPVVLPDRIKQIVLSRSKKEGELDVDRLEAFFNHVKKKMSPAKIAKQFTSDVLCLKEQLKWIVQEFYMTPKAGSGEDSRFMKWLEGMLERFDSVPSKRKKLKEESVE